MNKKLLCFITASFCFTNAAYAVCAKNSLIGVWKIHVTDTGSSSYPFSCELIIQKDGSLKNGSSCERDMVWSPMMTNPAPGMTDYSAPSKFAQNAKIVVDANCHVTGNLALDYSDKREEAIATVSSPNDNAALEQMYKNVPITMDAYLNTKGNDTIFGRVFRSDDDERLNTMVPSKRLISGVKTK